MMNVQERIAALMEEFKNRIGGYGFTIVATQGFAYTVGMAKYGLPEIIVSSPNPKMSHTLTAIVAKVFIYEGKCTEGLIVDAVPLRGDKFLSLNVEPTQSDGVVIDQYIVQAGNFYRSYPEYQVKPMSVCQVVWPDSKGLFPRDAGYDFDKCPQYIFKDVDHD
jgi:hypothetical protein